MAWIVDVKIPAFSPEVETAIAIAIYAITANTWIYYMVSKRAYVVNDCCFLSPNLRFCVVFT